MNETQQVTVIALFGAALLFVHLIFRIWFYYKSRKTRDLLDCLAIFLLNSHFLFIFLFYSGLLDDIPWFKWYRLVNVYLAMAVYYAFLQVSLTSKMHLSSVYLILVAMLPVQILFFLIHGLNYNGGFHQLLLDYTMYSVPEGFPTIDYVLFSIVNIFIWMYTFSNFLIKMNIKAGQSNNTFNRNNSRRVMDLFINPSSSTIRYFSIVFAMLIVTRLSYSLFALIGGRKWAIYFTSVEIIIVIINVALHETYPLLVKAKILKPVAQVFHTHNNIEKEVQIWQKIISLMENDKPWLDENFQLESLSKILGIKRNRTSEMINRHFGCTFNEFLHEYRICEAQKILKGQREVKPSLAGFEVGYKSMSAFYSAFRKKTGMSPQQYRESTKNGIR